MLSEKLGALYTEILSECSISLLPLLFVGGCVQTDRDETPHPPQLKIKTKISENKEEKEKSIILRQAEMECRKEHHFVEKTLCFMVQL